MIHGRKLHRCAVLPAEPGAIAYAPGRLAVRCPLEGCGRATVYAAPDRAALASLPRGGGSLPASCAWCGRAVSLEFRPARATKGTGGKARRAFAVELAAMDDTPPPSMAALATKKNDAPR